MTVTRGKADKYRRSAVSQGIADVAAAASRPTRDALSLTHGWLGNLAVYPTHRAPLGPHPALSSSPQRHPSTNPEQTLPPPPSRFTICLHFCVTMDSTEVYTGDRASR